MTDDCQRLPTIANDVILNSARMRRDATDVSSFRIFLVPRSARSRRVKRQASGVRRHLRLASRRMGNGAGIFDDAFVGRVRQCAHSCKRRICRITEFVAASHIRETSLPFATVFIFQSGNVCYRRCERFNWNISNLIVKIFYKYITGLRQSFFSGFEVKQIVFTL